MCPGALVVGGYEAGRRSGHGAKVPGAPSVRRRGGPAFVPHQASLTPHIASHGSVPSRCSSSSWTSYGVWVPPGTPPRRCWSPCARCAPHGRNRTRKRGSRTSRGPPFGGVGGFQVPARGAGLSPVSAAAHGGGELHPLLGREEPLQDGGAQLVDGVRGVGGVVRIRQPVAGPGAGSPGWRVTHNPEVAGSNPAPDRCVMSQDIGMGWTCILQVRPTSLWGLVACRWVGSSCGGRC